MPRRLRLTHPRLGFNVDVTVHERNGRCMATADLAEGSRDVGVGDTPQEGAKAALRSVGGRTRARWRREWRSLARCG